MKRLIKSIQIELVVLALLSAYLWSTKQLDWNLMMKTVWSALFVLVIVKGWLLKGFKGV